MASSKLGEMPQPAKRKPAASRLSSKKRRAKYIYVPLGFSSDLKITLRRFRTSRARRSKRYHQLVIRVYLLPVREVAVCLIKRKKRNKLAGLRLAFYRRAAAGLLFIGLGIGGLVYFGQNITQPVEVRLAEANPAPAVVEKVEPPPLTTLPSSQPIRVRIAKINVDTSLTILSKKTDGTMQVPSRYDIAGWYRHSPTPGELGPSVIVGHVDSTEGPAVFWRLRELQPGDTIEVDRADGKTAKFVIDEVKQLPQIGFPTSEVYGNIGHAGIRLITCGGTFDRTIRQYSHNTVVYGSLEL